MIGVAGLLPLTGLGLLVGMLIGAVGIGGVLLVPGLVTLSGMDVQTAIKACMFSYLFSGLFGAFAYARRGTIAWSMALWLCAGAMPGAYLGAIAVAVIPGAALKLIIAALVFLSGAHALSRSGPIDHHGRELGALTLGALGLVTGFGSALSGTGGPLILIPLLIWLRIPALTAVGLSQAIQFPIAALATFGNLRYGSVDFVTGTAIAVLLVIGVVVGANLAHRLPAVILRRVVAAVLVVVGVVLAARIGYAAFFSIGV